MTPLLSRLTIINIGNKFLYGFYVLEMIKVDLVLTKTNAERSIKIFLYKTKIISSFSVGTIELIIR
jgi:hypothetical protein